MKLCKDCRWFQPREGQQPLCDHPTSVNPTRTSLVTGELIPGYHYACADVRYFDAFSGMCGREGFHWEPADASPAGFT